MQPLKVRGQPGMKFHVKRWAAWAPGLSTREAWLAWASAATTKCPLGPDVPPLHEVTPMARRRIERLGRLAYQVAATCQGDERGMPAVFASRHGDVARSVSLLETLAQGEPLSPTSFGLSVHNAIGGQYSITRGDMANVVSVAAGPATAEAGAVEAWGLLQEHPEVLLVVYDVALPAVYGAFADEPAADFAWALRLARPLEGEKAVGLALEADAPDPAAAQAERPQAELPHALEVLRFFLRASDSATLTSTAAGVRWRWFHHG